MFKRSAFFAFICVVSSLAFGQDVKPVEVAAGDLTAALESLARQIGVELVYQTDQLKGLTTEGVAGVLSAEEAVSKLLEGTALTLTTDPSGAMLIAKEREESDSTSVVNASNFVGGRGLRLAQADRPSSQDEEDEEEEIVDPEYVSEENPRGIPEIMVIGKKGMGTFNIDIRRSEDDVQPYVVFDRVFVEQSGATDLRDLLTHELPMMSSPATEGGLNGTHTLFRLRGLSTKETLILVDGRRIASVGNAGGVQQANLNGIPLSAVERIEILPTTASGIYGGSATGGVINVVLRRDYAGVDAAVTYKSSFDGNGSTRRVDLSSGFTFNGGNTSVMLSGAYMDADDLIMRERDLLQGGRMHILANNPEAILDAFSPPLGATTNIRSTSGNLTLKNSGVSLNSPITFVPVGYAGISSDGGAALITNAGQYNLGLANTAQRNGGGNARLAGDPSLESLTLALRQDFILGSQLFVDLSASNTATSVRHSAAGSTFVLPASAPNNPFEQDLRISTPALGADGTTTSSVRDRKAVAGAIVKLPRTWQAELSYTWSRSGFEYSDPVRLSAEAASAVRTGALDVMRDTNAFPTSFSNYVLAPNVYEPAHSTLKEAAARLAGPIWELPAGHVTGSVLLSHRAEALNDQFRIGASNSTFYPSRSQTVDSAYAEVRVPLVSERNDVNGIKEIELQLAARWDQYETDGANSISFPASSAPDPEMVSRATNRFTSINPTIGLRYKPAESLMLRGSYGTGFLPPSMDQLVQNTPQVFDGLTFASIFQLTDPRRGNEVVGSMVEDVVLLSGGRADLEPEESRTWSFGAVVTPALLPSLRVSLDWIKLEKFDDITVIVRATQEDFDVEPFVENVIIRAPAQSGDPFAVGPVVGFDASLVNVSRRTVEAYDIAIDYQVKTERHGAFSISAMGTRQLHNQEQVTPGAPVEDNVGTRSGLKWNANATLKWDYDRWAVGWTTRHYDSYSVNNDHSFNIDQGAIEVPSQTYHDFFASYKLRGSSTKSSFSLLSDTEIQIGIKNVFDQTPPIDVVNTGSFYSSWGDPRLASYYLTIKKGFLGS